MSILLVPVLLAWGVFSLGATRPWGYVPLIAGMVICGATWLATGRDQHAVSRGLWVSIAMLCGAIFAQLIPLPADLAGLISPARAAVAGQTSEAAGQPLTVDPAATALGLTFIVALSLFFLGVVRRMKPGDASRMAAGIAAIGAVVALVGIAEAGTSWGGVYRTIGLPMPPDSTPLGPFSSRNHYVGWMLMALALTCGYLCAMLEATWGSRARTNGWRLVMAQGTVVAMAVALVQSRSRAGFLGLVLAAVTMGGMLIRRHAVRRVRMIVAAPLLLLPLAGVMATGVEPLITRFVSDSWATGHGRLPIWRQAVAMAQDFPLAGSGFNTYGRVVGAYPRPDLDEPYEGAHNDFLQVAVEGGLLVGVPLAAVAAVFARDASRRFRDDSSDGVTRWIRAGAAVGLALLLAQEAVDFSLQVPGNAALFAVLAAIAVHRAPPDTSQEQHRQPTSEGTRSYA